MRIGLTSPHAHPYVRRGAERFLHDLAWWLRTRDHEVTIVTTAPDATREIVDDDGVRIRYRHRGRPVGRGRLRLDELLRGVIPVARGLRRSDFDVVQAHHWYDGSAVRIAAKAPYVQWVPGVAHRGRFGGRPLHRLAFRTAVGGARHVVSLSEHAARTLRDELGIESKVVPPGVRTHLFSGPRDPTEHPIILCTAAADDARKQVDLLVRAFTTVHRDCPDARLVLAPPDVSAAERLVAATDPSTRTAIDIRPIDDDATLAELYRSASVTVLPSLDEAFGLVLVESLAAGTPVVGTDHGAIPEVVSADGIGQLFAPNDADDLARAIVASLELHDDPGTVERCRKEAQRWDWSRVGPEFEALYDGLV